MAEIPLHLEQLRGKISESLFEKALERVRRVNLITAHLHTRPDETFQAIGDKVGKEQSGKWAAHSVITSLDYTVLSRTNSSSRTFAGTIKANDMAMMADNPLSEIWGQDTAKAQNVIFSWDDINLKNIMFRGVNAPGLRGNEVSPVVPVKALARHFFEDLNQFADDTKVPTIIKAIKNAPESSSGSMGFLKQSFGLFDKPIEELSDAEQVEGIRNAIFMKAEAQGRMPELKQMLYYRGVKDLSGVEELVHNPADKLGINNMLKAAIKPDSAGGFYSDYNLGTSMEPFLAKAEHFYGPKFTRQHLQPLMQEMYDNGSKDLGFLISNEGGLFVGKAGMPASFVSLPAQVLESDVTAAGFQPGRLITGTKLRNARSLVRGSGGALKVDSAVEVLHDVFKMGLFDPYAGLKEGNEAIALKTARNRVSSLMSTIATNIQSRGEVATMQTLATSFSAVDEHSFESIKTELLNAIGAVTRMEDVRPAFEKYKTAIANMAFPQGSVESLMYAVKSKDHVLPTEGIREFVIPGSATENELVKGIYHQIKPLEITAPEEIENIRAASESVFKLSGRLFGPVSAGSVGLLEGEFKALSFTEKSLQGVEGKITGRQGRQAIAKYSMGIAYIGGLAPVEERALFGDPGITLTQLGREMHSNMVRPTEVFKATVSKKQLHQVLSSLAGGDLEDHPEFKQMFQDLQDNKRVFPTGFGLELDEKAYQETRNKVGKAFGKQLPRSATHLTISDVSEFDQTLTLGFSTRGTPGSISTLVGGQRITMVSPHGGTQFDQYDSIAHGVTGLETLKGINPAKRTFEHYTELSRMIDGGPEKFVELYQQEAERRGLTKDLISFKKTSSGAGHVVIESGKHYDKQFLKEFSQVGTSVLRKQGIPMGVIAGKAKAVAKFLGENPGEFSSMDKYFFSHVTRRIEETSDQLSQKNAFRLRLDTMNRWARGMVTTTGIKPKDNPFFMSMVNWFERQTGTSFTPEFLEHGVAASGNVLNKLPLNLKGYAASIAGDGAVQKLIKEHTLDVIDEKRAAELYLNGPHGLSLSKETTTGEYLLGDLKKSALFNPALRPEEHKKGFFIRVNEGQRVPLSEGQYKQGPMIEGVNYVFVPGHATDADRRLFNVPLRGDDSMLTRLPTEGVERNLLGVISSFANKPGEKGTIKGTKEGYIQDLFRSIAGLAGKGGSIQDKALVSRKMPGSLNARIIPFAGEDITSVLNQARSLTEKDFTIGISYRDLRKALASIPKKLRKGQTISELTADTVARIKKGEAFGVIHPYPVHTTQQFSAVKLKLIKNVEDAGKSSESRIMMSPFAMWLHHRDTDKDTIQTYIESMVLHKSDVKDQRKYFDAQLENSKELHQQFQRELDRAKEKGKTLKQFLRENKRTAKELITLRQKQLGFGNTPPLSFALERSLTGLGAELGDMSRDSDKVASVLNDQAKSRGLLRGKFTGEEISGIRQAMQGFGKAGLRELTGLASVMYGNPLQGFIQKGGKFTEPLIDYLGQGHSIMQNVKKGGTVEQSMEMSYQAHKKLYEAMSQENKLQIPDFLVRQAREEGVSPLELAARKSGAVLGGILHLKASKYTEEGLKRLGASDFDVLREVTRKSDGNATLESITRFTLGEGIDPERIVSGHGVSAKSQEKIADLNKAKAVEAAEDIAKPVKGESEVFKKAASWLTNNYKAVGIVAGGLVAARLVSSMLTDDELERPPLRSSKALGLRPAPLPPEPMISQPLPDIQPNLQSPKVYVQRPLARYSQNNYRGSYSSVNTNDLSAALSSAPIAADHGSFRIQDSREFKSNWELQSIADRAGDSDFLNPFGMA